MEHICLRCDISPAFWAAQMRSVQFGSVVSDDICGRAISMFWGAKGKENDSKLSVGEESLFFFNIYLGKVRSRTGVLYGTIYIIIE